MTIAVSIKVKPSLEEPPGRRNDLKTRIRDVAAVAAMNADLVDRDSRFPSEALSAARDSQLLGIMVPTDLGGEGASLRDVIDVCYGLGRACASTGMIYAMHQTKLACLVRHGRGSTWLENVMRQVDQRQLLLASSTTEGQGGGNIRSSAAPVLHQDQSISLERTASVISYGLQADGLVTTARRGPNALDSDQVLCVFLKSDYTLEPLFGWDTLGMRGTCSRGFKLNATGSAAQILPDPYEKIHAQTMMPVAHLLWGGVWTGIAASAVERARLFVRNAAKNSGGQLPPGSAHLTNAAAGLKSLRGLMNANARTFERLAEDRAALSTIAFQTTMNMLKVEASERAVAITLSALRACGLSGYRNDGAFSISRLLRDALSSPIMINNDRILANLATSALLDETPGFLID